MSKTANLEDFLRSAHHEFDFLVKEYHLVITDDAQTKNEFSVCYKSDTVQVVVEGINWGMNVRVAIGRCYSFENYDLYDLVKAKTGEHPALAEDHSLGQISQLAPLAQLLKENGTEVLKGDFSLFPKIAEIVDKRGRSFDDGREHFVI